MNFKGKKFILAANDPRNGFVHQVNAIQCYYSSCNNIRRYQFIEQKPAYGNGHNRIDVGIEGDLLGRQMLQGIQISDKTNDRTE